MGLALADCRLHVCSRSQLNLSSNGLGPEGAKALAPALVRSSLTTVCASRETTRIFPQTALLSDSLTRLLQVNLSANRLCGVWTEGLFQQKGTYTAEGIKAIADAMRVAASLTSLSLAQNDLGDDGAEALSVGLKQNKSLTSLDLSGKGYGDGRIGPKGATALASAIAVMPSLTSVRASPELQPKGSALTHFLPRVHRSMLATMTSMRRPRWSSSLR